MTLADGAAAGACGLLVALFAADLWAGLRRKR